MEIQKNETLIRVKKDQKIPGGFLALFFALPVLYFFIYSPGGYCDTDDGFVHGISWRILNGEDIYTDFTYVRPPLTPFLHTLELTLFPGHSALAGRAMGLLFLWLTVLFSILALRKFSDQLKESAWLIGCVAFILEVHNAPANPWHTTDGLLFASLGFFLITRSASDGWLLAGLASFLLSALAKQSFYLMPLAGLATVGLLYGRKKFIHAALLLAGMVLLALLAALALAPNAFRLMLEQTTGITTARDLLETGLIEYLKPATAIAILVTGLVVRPRIFFQAETGRKYPLLAFVGLLGALFLLNIITAFREQTFRAPSFGWAQSLFIYSAASALFFPGIPKPLRALLLGQLFLTWSAAISWGYAISIHSAVPMAATLYLTLHWTFGKKNTDRAIAALGFLLLAGFYLLQQFPYRDALRAELAPLPADSNVQALGGMKMGDYNRRQILALLAHHRKDPLPFTVMPAMPQANLITGTRNPFPWEWEHNAEVNIRDTATTVETWLDPRFGWPVKVLIQKNHLDELGRDGKYGSWVANYIRQNWRKTGEDDFFEIYIREKKP